MKRVVDNPCFICICAIHLAIPQMIDQCAVGEAVVEAQRREAIHLNTWETLNMQMTAVTEQTLLDR